MKYVLVAGGVLSGIGKGVAASSIGLLLRSAGYRVTAIKIDPYLNIDAGTMSPFEHGEVFVLDDGGEVDLDLGNYERFLEVRLSKENNITTGKIYQHVLASERKGDYLGSTVQVIPHITDAIQDWIQTVARNPVDGSTGAPDVCVIELGGTIGDIESMPFIEALRQLSFKVGPENFCTLLVSLVPLLGASPGEHKTKPTQHCVKEFRGLGMSPDVILCRSTRELDEATKSKLALFCQVHNDSVTSVHDVPNLYHVPLMLLEQKVLRQVTAKLKLNYNPDGPAPNQILADWRALTTRVDRFAEPVHICIVGKYTGLQDSYLSVIRALQHASFEVGRRLEIDWIDATDLEVNTKVSHPEKYEQGWKLVTSADGILVPGGFGDRGSQGKMAACQYARVNKKPYLGICFGMQLAVLEYAVTVLGLRQANSTEFDQATPEPLIIYMPEISKTQMGGTMRLGLRRTLLTTEDCMAYKLYGRSMTHDERHRHRYEVNPAYVERLQGAGLRFVGQDETGKRMEVVELPRDVHPFFFGHQAHPEFRSGPGRPSPPFFGLLMAATGQLDQWLASH